jgi:peptidoglycan/LPS O-acetylase OafA/YrhL
MGRYQHYSRRRRRRAANAHQRLDIQGLRMVAVLTVFANHLWGWPHGGFVGVDVFFVISGFLITGNLLRHAEKHGTVSFGDFYWNRVRRIVPAATMVVIFTYLAAVALFLPFRANQVGIDGLFALVFLSNWWFSYQDTDYFRAAAETVSPLQHYWSLSIEEQFYFVWPALIFVISVFVLRKAWTHSHRMQLAAGVMTAIVALSLGWAIYQTATAAAAAYFNTFSRVWELGIGALLACSIGALGRIPSAFRPVVSWAGLLLIGASMVLLSDGATGFPAPWAVLPVVGASLVIAAGVGGEPKYQGFLRNPLSGYTGDISYSLYLVHWPIIVFLGQLMERGPVYDLAVVALAFGLAIASYHFIETPMRKADWSTFRTAVRSLRKRQYTARRSTEFAAVGAASLVVVAALAYTLRPVANSQTALPPEVVVSVADSVQAADNSELGPLNTALQEEMVAAVKTSEWPALDPTMEEVFTGQIQDPQIDDCGQFGPAPGANCTWGPGPTRIVVVGDSVASIYAESLRTLPGVQLHTEALNACAFVDALLERASLKEECDARKQHAIEYINAEKPDIVVVSDSYRPVPFVGSDRNFTPQEWSQAMTPMLNSIRGSVGKIVFVAPPPDGGHIRECVSKRASNPSDCLSRVPSEWLAMARAEQDLAQSFDGVWIDSRPWFCTGNGYCPSFVGVTPVMYDDVHMSHPYNQKIASVIGESLGIAGVF